MWFPRAVPQSPGFGLLSPFHDEGEQSCGKKEEEESTENPVDLCIGQSKVQSYCNGDEDVGCGHKDKKRDDHPSSRPALLVEKRPRQTSLVIQRPHAETSILPYRQSPSGGESPDYGTPLAKKENQAHAVQHDGHQLGVFWEDVQQHKEATHGSSPIQYSDNRQHRSQPVMRRKPCDA